MKAFYFSNKERKLRYGDNRVIRTGRTHNISGVVKLCYNGLHASEKLLDAVRYAPDAILWHVELGGTIVRGKDKVAASERTYLASFDATKLLKEFARKQALINIEKIKPHCSEVDYDLIVRYLKTGDEEIREAAQKAARSVADWAAHSASSAAYWVAYSVHQATRFASSAAHSAAHSAAESAAESACWVAYLAAESAANASDDYKKHTKGANKMLTEMVREAAGWVI